MNTAAVIDPPKTETPVATPVIAPQTEEEQAALVDSLLKPRKITDTQVQPPKPAPTPEVKKEPVKEPEKKTESDADRNFAALRQKAEEAEKRAIESEARLKAREEEFEKNPVPKEFEEKLTAAEKRALEMQKELRASNLARDPDFQAKYSSGIESAMERMIQAAQAAGIDAKEAKSIVLQWNEQKFGEWIGEMQPTQRLQFEAAYQHAVTLDSQRSHELANADKAWEQMQKERSADSERAQKQYMDMLRSDRRAVLAELSDTHELFKTDEALRKETEGLLDKAAGLNGERMTTRQILQNLANGHVLARNFQRVEKENGELREQLATEKKARAEQDEFIKGLSASNPNINPTVKKTEGAPDAAFIDGLIKPPVKV